jgi:hypothetical protein
MDQAYAAKTLADLDALLVDLPMPSNRLVPVSPGRPARPSRTSRSLPFVAARYAALDAAAVVIWLATGRSATFWPVWVIIFTALLFARRAIRVLERRSAARKAEIERRGRPWLP